MINQFIQEIITEYGSPFSAGLIRNDQRKKLDEAQFEIIKNAFNIEKEFAQYIECTGNDCNDEMEVRKKSNGSRYASCGSCGRLDKIDDDQDLAYKLTLDGLANFLILRLEIQKNKTSIKAGEALYLGSRKMEGLGDLTINFYLARNFDSLKELTNHFKKNLNKDLAIIIKLDNQIISTNEARIANCQFNKITFYDENLKQFSINYKVLIDATKGCFSGSSQTMLQKFLNDKCSKWFKELVKRGAIKKGEKEKYQILANDYFNVSPNKFREIWQKLASNTLKAGGKPKT